MRDLIWGRADTLVWLDYAFPLVLWRLTTRTLRRIAIQETVCNGNRETWRHALHPRTSLFFWAFKTYWQRRREMPLMLAQPEYQHLALVRLRSSRDAAEWLAHAG